MPFYGPEGQRNLQPGDIGYREDNPSPLGYDSAGNTIQPVLPYQSIEALEEKRRQEQIADLQNKPGVLSSEGFQREPVTTINSDDAQARLNQAQNLIIQQ